MPKFNITIDGETHIMEADRCIVTDGVLIFYGPYSKTPSDYGVLRAIGKGQWTEVSLVTTSP